MQPQGLRQATVCVESFHEEEAAELPEGRGAIKGQGQRRARLPLSKAPTVARAQRAQGWRPRSRQREMKFKSFIEFFKGTGMFCCQRHLFFIFASSPGQGLTHCKGRLPPSQGREWLGPAGCVSVMRRAFPSVRNGVAVIQIS